MSPGYTCTGDQVFRECASVCGTCRDRQKPEEYCNEDTCVAGCACPDGLLLDDHGDCVPASQCSCFDSFDIENPIKHSGDVSIHGCAEW